MLPDRWFPDVSPVLDALLQALGTNWADLYSQLQYTGLQTRLATVSDGFLDMAAADFRDPSFSRRSGESDDAFRSRLLPIFRDKVTRAALIARLTDLGCTSITVFEPARPADVGGYGIAMGYGVAGAYGSLSLLNQSFITLTRPAGQGIPNIPGYSTTGGYGIAAAYARLSDEAPHVTDQDIYDVIVDTIPVGSVAWVRLTGASPVPLQARWGLGRWGVDLWA